MGFIKMSTIYYQNLQFNSKASIGRILINAFLTFFLGNALVFAAGAFIQTVNPDTSAQNILLIGNGLLACSVLVYIIFVYLRSRDMSYYELNDTGLAYRSSAKRFLWFSEKEINTYIAFADLRTIWLLRKNQCQYIAKDGTQVVVDTITEFDNLYESVVRAVEGTGVVCAIYNNESLKFINTPTQDFFIADSYISKVTCKYQSPQIYDLYLNEDPQQYGVIQYQEGRKGINPYSVFVGNQFVCKLLIHSGAGALIGNGIFQDGEHRIIGKSTYHMGVSFVDLTRATVQFGSEYYTVNGPQVLTAGGSVLGEITRSNRHFDVTLSATQPIPYYLGFMLLLNDRAFSDWSRNANDDD